MLIVMFVCSIHGAVQSVLQLIWRQSGLVENLVFFRYCTFAIYDAVLTLKHDSLNQVFFISFCYVVY